MKVRGGDEVVDLGDLELPTEEEMFHWAETQVELLSLSQQREVLGGYPEPPTSPGLYALVAPDGVTAKIVDEHVGRNELRSLVRYDVVRRMQRPMVEEFVLGLGEGVTSEQWKQKFEQFEERGYANFLELKKQYRLEKLPSEKID